MPLSIIFCTFLLWIFHFLFSYILINTNYWIDDKFIKQSYRCSMKKTKQNGVCWQSSTNWKHDDVCLISLWVWTSLQLLAGDYAEIRRWNNLLYTHQRSFNYNERMKLNIITKVKEVRRRTGSACGVSIHVHENTFRQEFYDKTQWVMVVWCRQWSICVSAGLGFIFYQFQSVFCQTFPFLDLKGVK